MAQHIRSERERLEKYGEMLQLEAEARTKLRQAQKIEEELRTKHQSLLQKHQENANHSEKNQKQ